MIMLQILAYTFVKIDEYLKNYTYMKSQIFDSVITCDEILDIQDYVENSNDRNVMCKMDYYIPHTLLSVAILLLTIVTICYYFIKHRLKQTDILPYQYYENGE